MGVINIILPVYNAEKYLAKLFESILNQSFQDFTLFVVDDCSTDNSGTILSKYSEILGEKMVLIKNLQNIKLGKTRNVGLEMAEKEPSEYTTFLDADDWIEFDHLENMYKKAKEKDADIVVCGIRRIEEDSGRVVCDEAIDGETIILDSRKNLWELAYINPAVYNKLYKTDKILGVRFKDLKRSEDTCYLFEVLSNVNCVAYTNTVGYYYRLRKDSLTGSIQSNVCDSMISGYVELLGEISNKKIVFWDELVAQFFIRLVFGGVLKASLNNVSALEPMIITVNSFLEEYVPDWRENSYLSMRVRSKNMKAFLLKICASLYKQGLFRWVVVLYRFMLSVAKKDIRM